MLCHCSLLLLSFFLTCKVLSLTSSRNTRQIPIKKITDKASLTNLTSVKKRQSISQSLFSFCLVCTRFDLVSYETCTIPIIGSFGVATCYGKSLLCKFNIFKGSGNSIVSFYLSFHCCYITWYFCGWNFMDYFLVSLDFANFTPQDAGLHYSLKNILIIWSFWFSSLLSFPTFYEIQNGWSYSWNLYITWPYTVSIDSWYNCKNPFFNGNINSLIVFNF